MATGFGFDRDAVVDAARQLTHVRSDLESTGQQTPRLAATGSRDVDVALTDFTTAATRHRAGLLAAVAAAAARLDGVVAGHAQLDSALGSQLPTNQPSKGKTHE
ncbi:hypothetical protein AB0B39_10445 [Micromonospora sp. NPDC049114]|uniref:hypothetical protein n=1 Tax=unclassified Micromonospora TaxID=2617518 RepID=UPI001F37BABB|nr:hypothetical protein [Micromonospora sp. MH99]MCF0092891.1 hypothetical protein [Micromonospora sp. MH99]